MDEPVLARNFNAYPEATGIEDKCWSVRTVHNMPVDDP